MEAPGERLLSQANIDSLTAGGGLCSLTLQENIPIGENYSLNFVDAFTVLTHLSVQATSTNVTSLIDALRRLSKLRALELSAPKLDASRIIDWTKVLGAIASCRPELEHLAIDLLLQPRLISADPLLRFTRLVSFKVSGSYLETTPSISALKWQWLEELTSKGRLEHLVVDMKEEQTPLDMLCRVIRHGAVS